MAIVDGLAHMHSEPLDLASLMAEWNAAPPMLRFSLYEDTLLLRQRGGVRLPINIASLGSARRLIAQRVRSECEYPQAATGSEAIEMCTETLFPLVTAVLDDMIASWSVEAIRVVAEHINDAHADFRRRTVEIDQALSTPWAHRWRHHALTVADPFKISRSLDLLIERMLPAEVRGMIVPDVFDIAIAVELTDIAFEIGISVAGAKRKLHDLIAVLDGRGDLRVAALPPNVTVATADAEPVPAPRIDGSAYREALRRHSLQSRPDSESAPDPALLARHGVKTWESTPFIGLTAGGVPPELLEADQALSNALGTGIDGLSAVLGTAVSWQPRNDDVSIVTREELILESASWSGLDRSAIEAATELLTLRAAELRSAGWNIWELERREHRLVTRPLIALDEDRLLIIPWRLRATQELFAAYAEDGSLPWPRSSLPHEVREAFLRYRQIQNDDLEKQTEGIAISLQWPRRRNATSEDLAEVDLSVSGEIDLIAVDLDRHRVWVCEVKDLTPAFSPSTIASRLDRFGSEKRYVAKLLKKAEEIRRNPRAAARLAGVEQEVSDWIVEPLMVTRRIEPSAFLLGVEVGYALVEQLKDLWMGGEAPIHGYQPITDTSS